jgi:hypothetical protein
MLLTFARLCRVVCMPCRLDSRIAGIGLGHGNLPNPKQVIPK